jgi:hypothetical protein
LLKNAPFAGKIQALKNTRAAFHIVSEFILSVVEGPKTPQIIPDPLGLERMKCACTILLSAKKIKFFYSLFHNHLQILHLKKIPDFRIKYASLCFIWKAQGRCQQATL